MPLVYVVIFWAIVYTVAFHGRSSIKLDTLYRDLNDNKNENINLDPNHDYGSDGESD